MAAGHGPAARPGAGHRRCGPRLFSPAERENGKAAWLLGASFISEGAIPFAAADPLRVIPPVMLGARRDRRDRHGLRRRRCSAPHGGIFVFFAIGGIAGFLVALAVGTAVGGAAVVAAKSARPATTDADSAA